jgi:hypothetical protein
MTEKLSVPAAWNEPGADCAGTYFSLITAAAYIHALRNWLSKLHPDTLESLFLVSGELEHDN